MIHLHAFVYCEKLERVAFSSLYQFEYFKWNPWKPNSENSKNPSLMSRLKYVQMPPDAGEVRAY